MVICICIYLVRIRADMRMCHVVSYKCCPPRLVTASAPAARASVSQCPFSHPSRHLRPSAPPPPPPPLPPDAAAGGTGARLQASGKTEAAVARTRGRYSARLCIWGLTLRGCWAASSSSTSVLVLVLVLVLVDVLVDNSNSIVPPAAASSRNTIQQVQAHQW
jgi:hypothetical protein